MYSTLQWKAHTDPLLMTPIAACYALRTQKLIMLQQILLMVYFSAFHLIVSYGIIFWVAAPHSINIFRLQKGK
jgi:hypothetical protein